MLTRQLNIKSLPFPTLQNSITTLKFSSVNYAHQLFDKSPHRGITSFLNNFMLTCIHQNLTFKALHAFKTELRVNYLHGFDQDSVAIAIKACHGDLKPGLVIHGFAVSSGFVRFRSVSNSLMSMYCKSGKFDHVIRVFDSIDEPDTVSYNTVLRGFQNNDEALSFVWEMYAKGVVFDPFSYTTALSFCLDEKGFLFGFQLHCNIIKSGFCSEVFVGNALITLYSRWGRRICEAEKVFDEMKCKDSVCWNAMLCGYSQEGSYGHETLCTFSEMMRLGFKPDHISLNAVISSCGYDRNLKIGKLLHALSVKVGYGKHGSICDLLMSMYAKCEINEDVKLAFEDMSERNVVSWTTMISVFEKDAISLFREMRIDGVYPNDITFISLLYSVALGNLVNEGRMIHGFCVKTGFVLELNVSNSLVTMYSSCESMGDSLKVFEELEYRDIVSWNTLISGFNQNKLYQEALEAFYLAILETRPNEYTIGSVLSAIASAEDISLQHGQKCHSRLFQLGLNSNPYVSSALLDMYAKRGSLSESKRVFEETDEKTQFAWTAIVSAHSRHGDYDSVMNIFKEMVNEGVKPDSITFLSIITACGRKGMVEKGREIWESMIRDNLIEPSQEHYACMVDMFGRAGRLKEAEELISRIPEGPSFSALQSLLGACRIHRDVEMAERISNLLVKVEPEESGFYVGISNMYAEKKDWAKVAEIRKKMRDRRVRKEVGISRVDADGSLIMHGFSSGDRSNPRSEDIYRMAGELGLEMKFLETETERQNKGLIDDLN